MALKGTVQRATLGYLLLHSNTVVATSELVDALWPRDAPATARKMLQNAVSYLRGTLRPHQETDRPLLLTHPPGYVLRTETENVDLLRFRDLVDRGRAELAAGRWERASGQLREALSLWRGPVLADLVERGLDWQPAKSVHDLRLAAREHLGEAELACGRHAEALADLEALARANPTSERICELLMLALYRCGRQTDALTVYRRTRRFLVDRLGLEPGPGLREVERAILSHSPKLGAPWSRLFEEQLVDTGRRPTAARTRREPPHTPALPAADEPTGPAMAPPPPPPPPRSATPAAARPRIERKQVTAVLVSSRTRASLDDPEEADRLLSDIASTIREAVERHGGIVSGRFGGMTFALFGAHRTREDDADRAVRAAEDIDARLGPELVLRIAVATGDTLVRYRPGFGADSVPEATGGLLETCERLLENVPQGGLQISRRTRQTQEVLDHYRAVRKECSLLPFVGRDGELALLRELFQQTRQRARPHVVTLLGESGVGKSRLVAELDHDLRHTPEPARTAHVRCCSYGYASGLADMVRACTGVDGVKSPGAALETLTVAVHRIAGTGNTATWLLSHLVPLLTQRGRVRPDTSPRAWFAAARHFLEETAAQRPLLLVVDDLQWADELTLDFVEYLATSTRPVPLYLVAVARPELLERRPSWTGGAEGMSIITLGPLAAPAVSRLMAAVLPETDPAGLLSAVMALTGGNPLFVMEYARELRGAPDTARGAGLTSTPWLLRNVMASTLDALPQRVKGVLQDAAVHGHTVVPSAVAAARGRDLGEVTTALEYLERREFLRRDSTGVGGEARFVFRYDLVRDVARSQVPRRIPVTDG
ncbi:BTAD domain-containing putative transcriptional regulator [Streptomyces sp. NPDC050560]|uniref:BTAD domain-containing putative transcriptional regulator n=1 Tax=Streptomyces sp. NPDC050560 TaxID=3365630 RepID=UPI0037A2D305